MKTLKNSLTLKTILFFCLVIAFFNSSGQVSTGKGYVNITKGAGGGTFEANDIIEIRSTITVSSGTIYKVRYADTIPASVTYIAGSMKLMTNENFVYATYTDAGGDDGGIYNSGSKILKMFIGPQPGSGAYTTNTVNSPDPAVAVAENTNAPQVKNNDRPSFYGGRSIIVVSYRVQINNAVPYNTSITFPGGSFYYATSNAVGAPIVTTHPGPYIISTLKNNGLCSNKVSNNSALENGGTFDHGTLQNRGTASTLVPSGGFTKINIASGSPADGEYSIVNNLSPTGSTAGNAFYGANPDRVFGVWEVSGDHTNASNTALGNNAVAPGTDGGYMLVVNASFANGEAISQPVSGLCDETYYEFSAWVKNICRYCSCDPAGQGVFKSNGSYNPSYSPTTAGDSSGVKPNLTFEVDGKALYTTGDLAFSGQWVKKGFIFKTATGQTNFTITIRNNSTGGGGNDWVLDDLTIATCGPNITITPHSVTNCANNPVDMQATVRYFESNYQYYIWEKSTNNGATWSSTPQTGTGVPVLVAGQYQYTAAYPTFVASTPDSGNRYRLRVASSLPNLSGACSFIDTNQANLVIFSCDTTLPVKVHSFSGWLKDNKVTISWLAENETPGITYELQKSLDGQTFSTLSEINGRVTGNREYYQQDDGQISQNIIYYRLKITESPGRIFYTPVVVVKQKPDNFSVRLLENPVRDKLTIALTSSATGRVRAILYSTAGVEISRESFSVNTGFSYLNLFQQSTIHPGIYILKISSDQGVYTGKIIKQ